jgi:hypothetical protein
VGYRYRGRQAGAAPEAIETCRHGNEIHLHLARVSCCRSLTEFAFSFFHGDFLLFSFN